MIELEGVGHQYPDAGPVLSAATLRIGEGEYVGIVGKNGSGKSTLLRIMAGLIAPVRGRVRVDGLDPFEPQQALDVRQRVGLLFQNPDNQIVGTIVEDDVAFGPENLGLCREEIRERVEQALVRVGLAGYRHQSPQNLSGGQKQRLAIASLLALRPRYLLLDEPVSMLDSASRESVMDLIEELHRDYRVTLVHVAHSLEELSRADRILALGVPGRSRSGGVEPPGSQVLWDGPYLEFLAKDALLESLELEPSTLVMVCRILRREGLIGTGVRPRVQDLVEELARGREPDGGR